MRISDWSSDVCSSDLKFFGRGWFVPFAPPIGGVSMRAPIALPVMLPLLCVGIAARVDAQIALPSVQLPRTLPSLPDVGVEPLTAVRETRAQVRLDRNAPLLRRTRDRHQPNRNGQPAGRGL